MSTQARPNKRKRVARVGVAAALLAGTIGGVLGATGTASAVVEGDPISISEAPYQVSLRSGGDIFCGGSVIDATRIVTAAHCTQGLTAGEITVRAGVSEYADSSGQDVRVASIIDNPSYATDGASDISVLVLATPLRLNDRVQPIALANAGQVANATTATVTGWGQLSETNEDIPDRLQSAVVPLVDDATCAVALDGDLYQESEQCAGGTETDSCYGDSGGPLVIRDANGRPMLAGVVSWGIECGGSEPAVYAEVSAFVDWINSVNADTPEPDRPDGSASDEFDDEFEGDFQDDFGSELEGDAYWEDDALADEVDGWDDWAFEDSDWQGDWDHGDWEDSAEDWEFEDDPYDGGPYGEDAFGEDDEFCWEEQDDLGWFVVCEGDEL